MQNEWLRRPTKRRPGFRILAVCELDVEAAGQFTGFSQRDGIQRADCRIAGSAANSPEAIFEHEISPWVELHAAGESTSEAKLVLDHGTMLTVEVSETDETLDPRYVEVADETTLIVASALLPNGGTKLGPLLPGIYAVTVHGARRTPSATQSVTLTQERERKVRIALP